MRTTWCVPFASSSLKWQEPQTFENHDVLLRCKTAKGHNPTSWPKNPLWQLVLSEVYTPLPLPSSSIYCNVVPCISSLSGSPLYFLYVPLAFGEWEAEIKIPVAHSSCWGFTWGKVTNCLYPEKSFSSNNSHARWRLYLHCSIAAQDPKAAKGSLALWHRRLLMVFWKKVLYFWDQRFSAF